MLFPVLELESIVQVDDKTRLSGLKSYISKDESAITLVEIEPEASAGFIDVTGTGSDDFYLDWQYSTDGVKTVSIRLTNAGGSSLITKDLTVVTKAEDYLFSADSDLIGYEGDLLNYVRPGRNSFLDKHRAAQSKIVSFLDEKGVTDDNGDRLTKVAIVNLEEVKEWSTALTLSIIFEEISNAVDDIFMDKSQKYKQAALTHKNRAFLRLDKDGDGDSDEQDGKSVITQGYIGRV